VARTSSTATTSTPPPNSGQTAGALRIGADPSGQLKFTTSVLTAKAGTVTIRFTSSAPLAHNLMVASTGGAVIGATPTFQGGTKTLTLNLKPGTYTFYCSVPGHREGGMHGTLTVR
jgi:plastocyanin